MAKSAKRVALFGVLVCLVVALTGCPKPPFNATGEYEGTWETENTEIPAQTCDLSMSLFQLPGVPIVNFKVAGLVTLNWDCILSQAVRDFLGITLPDMTLPVFGEMGRGNPASLVLTLDLNLEEIPASLMELLDFDPNQDIPVENLQLTLDGMGEDTDDDGVMDEFTGDITLSADYDDNGIDKTLDVEGTFSVGSV